MTKKTYYLKNMISISCIKLIEVYFGTIDTVNIKKNNLGEVELEYDSKRITEKEILNHFNKLDFYEIVNPDTILVEQIKIAAIELIHLANNTNSLIRNSDYISERVQQPYAKISKVFSSETDITLEKYLILLKIEKTKELIAEDEYSMSEIAYTLGYSSVQYLSNQFKSITGYTLSQFKRLDNYIRKPLEKLI
jgi:YesN/AraC family two-component response regulator